MSPSRRQIGTSALGGLIVLVTIIGCAAPPVVVEEPPAAHPDFFVANRWIDRDRSGGADYWEFEGANKWTFRSDESVTFVSRIQGNVGSTVSWELHAPDGQLVNQGASEQRWDSTWRRGYEGPVIGLLDEGGSGVWWVQWFINGQPAGKSAANLVH